MSYQTIIRCAWCSLNLDDAVAARKHITSECPQSPNVALRRAVDWLKSSDVLTDPNVTDAMVGIWARAAIKALP